MIDPLAQVAVPLTHRLVIIIVAALVGATTLEMIRRRKLREEYAMLWLFGSLILLILAVFPALPFMLQRAIGIQYLTIIVVVSFVLGALILMHFSITISRQAEQIRQLAERVAILQAQAEPPAPGQEASDPPPDADQTAPKESG